MGPRILSYSKEHEQTDRFKTPFASSARLTAASEGFLAHPVATRPSCMGWHLEVGARNHFDLSTSSGVINGRKPPIECNG